MPPIPPLRSLSSRSLICLGIAALLAFVTLIPTSAAQAEGQQAQTIEFDVRHLSDRGRVLCYITPEYIRVEQPARKFAVVYQKSSATFTGLNLRDGLWWSFSWNDIEKALRDTELFRDRLYDLNVQGFSRYDRPSATEAPTLTTAVPFRWRPAQGKGGARITKKISGYDTEQWLGSGSAGIDVVAYVTIQPVRGFAERMYRLREINEQLAVTTSAPIVPAIYFVVADSLSKAAATPVQIEWQGIDDTKANRVRLLSIGTGTLDSRHLKPPGSFRRVSLYTLKGIIPDEDELDPPPTNIAQ